RRGDALLQFAHFRRERRLVTHGAGHTAQERGHFRTGLRETEDVVDEHQHVRLLHIAEILGDSQTGEAYAQTRTRRLVHLTVNQLDLIENVGFLKLEVEVVAFTRALAHAAEHGLTTVFLRDVV